MREIKAVRKAAELDHGPRLEHPQNEGLRSLFAHGVTRVMDESCRRRCPHQRVAQGHVAEPEVHEQGGSEQASEDQTTEQELPGQRMHPIREWARRKSDARGGHPKRE